jgi:N-methylhydantoinase A
LDHVGCLLRDHDHRRVDVAPNHIRHDRGVNHAKAIDAYHLTVDRPEGEFADADKRPIKSAFDDLHRRTYGASAPEEDAELVTLRLVAEVPVPHLRLPRVGTARYADAAIDQRPLYDLTRQAFSEAGVYDRTRLNAHARISGPAIVEQYDSTTVVLAGQTVTVDDFGNLLITEEVR